MGGRDRGRGLILGVSLLRADDRDVMLEREYLNSGYALAFVSEE